MIKDFNGQRFGYDAESHQKEFFSASNQTTTPDATYHYDGEGRRVKKIVGTEVTVFVYDASGQLSAEYSTTVIPQAPAKVSYLTTDHLGSPRIITDQNGAVISRKDFTAFGEQVTSPQRKDGVDGNGYDPPNVRQDYTGYQKDNESGLEFAQARYYNTGHGRFTSVDPLTASATIRNPQTFNRYAYVTNSPYEFVDPLGLSRCNMGRCVQVGGGDWFTSGASSGADLDTTREAAQKNPDSPDRYGILDDSAFVYVSEEAVQAGIAAGGDKLEPFVVSNVDELARQAEAGTHPGYQSKDPNGTMDYECAELPQSWETEQEGAVVSRVNRNRRLTRNWVEGASAVGNPDIVSGTVAASGWDENGRYRSLEGGNHVIIIHKWATVGGEKGAWIISTVHAPPKYEFKNESYLQGFSVVMLPSKFYRPDRPCTTCRFYDE